MDVLWLFELFADWRLITLFAFLVGGAVIDCWKLKVPNWLTFSMMLSGLALGAAEAGFSGFVASLALLGFGFLLLWPLYAIGGMGAGDVKLQMGFGAWVGAIYGLADGFWIVLYGFCSAAIVGGILAVGLMIWHGRYRDYYTHAGDILSDIASARALHRAAERAEQRKAGMILLPYGLPLCIGFVGYLLLRIWTRSG
jgi:prepilin peptidase CpaA